MAATVDELLIRPFFKRKLKERRQIVIEGKPRPCLDWWMIYKEEKKIYYKPWSDVYNEIKCLTACERKRRMFCWPCLLSVPSKIRPHPKSLKYRKVLKTIQKHEKTRQHMKAVFKLQIFVMKHVKSDFEENPMQHNYVVKRNRDILKHIINAICFAAKKRKRDIKKYEPNMLEVSDCIHFLRLVRRCDISNKDVVDDAIKLLNHAPEIMNVVVDAITMALKITIANEARNSTYVSLILSEHVIHDQKSQVSTVLRFVKNGEVCERFVGFTNLVGQKWNLEFAGNHILNVKKGYEVQGNFLSLSVDGAVLPRKELLQLFKSPHWYKCTYFVPCHFQGFGRVMMQSVFSLGECALFFKITSEIESYFENEKYFKAFENVLCLTIPHLKKKKWYANSPFLLLLSVYRKHFLAYFKFLLTHSRYVPAEDFVTLTTFKKYLEELNTVFLLKVFSKIFGEDFDQNLNFYPPVKFGNGKFRFDKFRAILIVLNRGTGFEQIWTDTTTDMLGAEASEFEKVLRMKNVAKKEFYDLFKKITSSMLQELDSRYVDKNRLGFWDLMICQTDGVLSAKEMHVDVLASELKSDIDSGTLYAEMRVLEEDSSSILARKSVHELLQTIIEYNLQDVFSQLFILVQLLLSFPFLPAHPGDGKRTLKLKQMNNYSYIPQATGVPSGEISVICVEDLLLQDIKRSKSFYEEVIEKFSEMNKDMELKSV